MGTLVSYQLKDSVATITMDDGKVNVLSARMLAELGDALDRAVADRAVVVLTGRPGVFSAGFDLAVLRDGGAPSLAMVRAGFGLAARLLSFPAPGLAVTSSCWHRSQSFGPTRPARVERGPPRGTPLFPNRGTPGWIEKSVV